MHQALSDPHAIIAALRALGVVPVRLNNDSRRVQPGDIFVAYRGERADGRAYIEAAVGAGAAAVLWEVEGYGWPAHLTLPNLGVRGLRAVAGEIAAILSGHPSRHLWMVGVTGTNGKTSCSHWVAAALSELGRRTAVIGTLGHGYPGALSAFGNTTPDAIALHPLLRRLRDDGAQCVAMEVSSHALTQERVAGTHFDVALFTNLTRDHLDYHGDMQRYGQAKARLFRWPGLGCAVVNIDGEFGRHLVARLARRDTRVITYGLSGGTVSGHRLDLSRFGLTLQVETPWGGGRVASGLLGAYNATNLLGVLGVLLATDVPLQRALAVLAGLPPVEGRMQTLGGSERPLVVVDYAHTPDALQQVLCALRGHAGGGRLICVFGCGGDRDTGKRPLMGAVAARLADQAIVTSDNPRTEDPHAIIAQVVAGAGPQARTIVDRAQAIAEAIVQAHAGDVVLIAGKGHERYQEIGTERVPFSDAEAARRCLDRWTPPVQAGSGAGAGRGS